MLFRNKNSAISNIIAWGGQSAYSHVGMVVVNPPWRTDLHGVFLLESNVEPYRDAEDNEFKCGSTLSPLREVVKAYGSSNIHVRRLITDYRWTDNQLIKAHSVVHNRPYDFIWGHWVRAFLGMSIPPSYRAYWCSALVADVYRMLGLLPKDYDYTAATPQSFALGEKLPLQNGAILTPPQQLDLVNL